MDSAILLAALTLYNTFGGPSNQGYCFWAITLREFEYAFTDLEIDFTPVPLTAGHVETLTFEQIGTSHATQIQTDAIGGNCGINAFIVTRAVAMDGDKKIDLLKRRLVEVDTFRPTEIQVRK